MKNRAIEAMMAIQHNVSTSNVRVEFINVIGSEYHYEVTIWTEYTYEKFEVIVQSKVIT